MTGRELSDELAWENARVRRLEMGIEDHGIETGWVFLEGSSWSQGFGGLALPARSHRQSWRFGVGAVLGDGDYVKAKKLADAGGLLVRVGRDGGIITRIVAIRPILDGFPIFYIGRGLEGVSVFDFEGPW